MPDSTDVRKPGLHLRTYLPPDLAGATNLLGDLVTRGAVRRIGDDFRVARKAGGFVGLDAVIFLLAYFMSGWNVGGLRGFSEAFQPFMVVMAAVVGRARIMSQASLSRLLDVVNVDDARALGRRLLLEHVGALDVLRSLAVQTTDALGMSWHVLDFDPNREVYRRRELARGEARPVGDRRTETLAAPGHRGRKRGEVVLTQGLLIHAGSGLWVDASVQPGNGDPRVLLGNALEAVGALCDTLGHPRARSLVRTDGEFRGVPSFAAAVQAGVGFITRLSRYELLDDPAIRARLHDVQWERVEDAGGGPIRIATELGQVCLEAGETTLQADGTRFEPVDVRVIVSRYHCPLDAPDGGRRGHRIGESVFEMYGVIGATPEQWPAADMVAAYYGRCGQENRFAQVDRELGIDRSFSFQPGGHLLALICALATWNWQIVQAVKAHPLPLPTPPNARVRVLADPPPELTVAPPRTEQPEAQALPEPKADALAAIASTMSHPDVRAALHRRGLVWDAEKRVAENAASEVWDLSSAMLDHGTPSLRFSRLGGRSEDRRCVQMKVPESTMRIVQAALADVRHDRPRATLRTVTEPKPLSGHRKKRYILREEPAFRETLGPGFATGWPLFLPARARAHTRQARVAVIAEVSLPDVVSARGHPLMAMNADDVRRHRWTWAARLSKLAAPAGTHVVIRPAPPRAEVTRVRRQ